MPIEEARGPVFGRIGANNGISCRPTKERVIFRTGQLRSWGAGVGYLAFDVIQFFS